MPCNTATTRGVRGSVWPVLSQFNEPNRKISFLPNQTQRFDLMRKTESNLTTFCSSVRFNFHGFRNFVAGSIWSNPRIFIYTNLIQKQKQKKKNLINMSITGLQKIKQERTTCKIIKQQIYNYICSHIQHIVKRRERKNNISIQTI